MKQYFFEAHGAEGMLSSCPIPLMKTPERSNAWRSVMAPDREECRDVKFWRLVSEAGVVRAEIGNHHYRPRKK